MVVLDIIVLESVTITDNFGDSLAGMYILYSNPIFNRLFLRISAFNVDFHANGGIHGRIYIAERY